MYYQEKEKEDYFDSTEEKKPYIIIPDQQQLYTILHNTFNSKIHNKIKTQLQAVNKI